MRTQLIKTVRFCIVAVFCLSLAPVSSVSAWDYVWGDPGPSNYSKYQSAALGDDGSTFVAGFFSGDFYQLSSPNRYARFIQRITAQGEVAWTQRLGTETFTSIPDQPEVVVDGEGIVYSSFNDSGGTTLTSWSFDGRNLREIMVNFSQRRLRNGRTCLIALSSGIVFVPAPNAPRGNNRLQRFDSNLETVWSYELSEEIDNNLVEIANGPDDSI